MTQNRRMTAAVSAGDAAIPAVAWLARDRPIYDSPGRHFSNRSTSPGFRRRGKRDANQRQQDQAEEPDPPKNFTRRVRHHTGPLARKN